MKLESIGVIFNESECLIEIKYNMGLNNVKLTVNENKSKVLLRDFVEELKYFKQIKAINIDYVSNNCYEKTFDYEKPRLEYDFSKKKIQIEHYSCNDLSKSWSEVRSIRLTDLPNTRILTKFLNINYIELSTTQTNELSRYVKRKKTHHLYF